MEIKSCVICGEIFGGNRKRLYCHKKKCKGKYKYQRDKKNMLRRQKERHAKKATPAEGKEQCMICGLWYRNVILHVRKAHKEAGDYRELYGYNMYIPKKKFWDKIKLLLNI